MTRDGAARKLDGGGYALPCLCGGTACTREDGAPALTVEAFPGQDLALVGFGAAPIMVSLSSLLHVLEGKAP